MWRALTVVVLSASLSVELQHFSLILPFKQIRCPTPFTILYPIYSRSAYTFSLMTLIWFPLPVSVRVSPRSVFPIVMLSTFPTYLYVLLAADRTIGIYLRPVIRR